MIRPIAALIAAGAFGLALGAFAQPPTPDPGVTSPSQPAGKSLDAMAAKHLALVNVYLDQAVLNTKAISTLSEHGVPVRETHIAELTRNLDTSVKGAITHLGHLRNMKDPGMTRLEDLNQSLKDLRASVLQLKKAKAADFEGRIDQVGSNLSSAQQIFRDLAKAASFTRLEDLTLQTVPVRGIHDSDTQEIDRVRRDPTRMLPEPARPTSPPSVTSPPRY